MNLAAPALLEYTLLHLIFIGNQNVMQNFLSPPFLGHAVSLYNNFHESQGAGKLCNSAEN